MARVKDLWHSEVSDPKDPGKKIKKKTARHPDNGGSKDAKRWLAVWIGPDGKEKTQAFRIQDQAKKHARKMEEDVERGSYIDPNEGKKLLGPLGRKWLGLRKVGATSAERYERAYRLHVEPTFGHRQVKSVRPSEVAEWLQELAQTRGEATQRLAYLILSGIFELAVADGMRRDNPAKSKIVEPPRVDAEEREPWTTEQVRAVVDAHPARFRTIPILGAGCGLRIGETLALAEEDFDFAEGVVRIRRQLARVGRGWSFKLPKGGKVRVAPLSPGVARVVEAWIAENPPRPYALPWIGEDGKRADEEHVCSILFRAETRDVRTHDQHIRKSAYEQKVWKPALAAAGIIEAPEAGARGGTYGKYESSPDDGSHILRHWTTSVLLDAGVSLAGVMDFLGHSRKGQVVTLSRYAHVTAETYEAARNAIDRALFPLRIIQDHSSGGTAAEQAVAR